MDLRVPLSRLLLCAHIGKRHAIPHRTLFLDATHPFVSYLTSEDTRLPQHSDLSVEARPAEEYETYVGEDVWKRQDGVADPNGPDAAPRFDDVVQWVAETLEEIGSDGDGVVLCGQRVVADDCGWAVFSRTPTLLSLRDVFIAMRNSSKFIRDVHHQLRTIASAGAVAPAKVELTLAKALGGNQAREFRAFLPYRLYTSDGEVHVEAWEGHMYAGISQRATDVCFPSLMAWDEAEHDEYYAIVMRHVKNAKLLESAFESDAQFRQALLRQTDKLSPAADVTKGDSAVVLLAVDVLFESASLPVYLLSAAVRCFPHDDVKDPTCAFPLILEEGAAAGDDTDEKNNKDNNNDSSTANDNAANADDESKSNDDDEEEDEDLLLCDSVSFFRLFRDVANWNRHVEVWRNRGCAAGTEKARRFFVVASERNDLATTKESLAKRGIPLEFLHPELFMGDDNFLQEWREKLMQTLDMAKQCQGS